jgi:hypothetical protein
MAREKKYLGIGLIVGVFLSSLFLYYFAPRYRTVISGETLIKYDKWSGQSWRLIDNEWKRIMDAGRDWDTIDQALREALRLSPSGLQRNEALRLLKEKYPALKDVANEELLERIKIVYSKEILCNLYLSNLVKLEDGPQSQIVNSK